MINALLLVFEPVATWERLFRSQRGVIFVSVVNLLPMLVLSSIAEGWGLVRWGKRLGVAEHLKFFTPDEAIRFELLQNCALLLIILGTAFLLRSMCNTFHGRQGYTQAFRTLVYGLSPLFLLRLLDGLPSLSPWVPWAVGVLLSVGVLYLGLPRMMEPDPPHAFGLYLITSLVLILATGLLRGLVVGLFLGKFSKLQTLISG